MEKSIQPADLKELCSKSNVLRHFLILVLLFFGISVKQVNAQSGNLDQGRNGAANSPISPVELANGNAGSSNSHYLESMSVGYRCVLTGLTPGAHNFEIEWPIKTGGKNAFDFITHYQRLEPHAQFSHAAEVINPLIGLSGINNTPATYPIPVPIPSKNVLCTNLPQPQTAFNALPANERMMTMFNGTAITNAQYVYNADGNYGDLNAASSDSRIRISFTTTNSTVVFAWGAHLTSISDWCPGNSASDINGSPYHMTLVSIDGNGLGSQAKSLSAAAVIPVPPCDILGNDNVCRSQLVTYSVSPYIGYTYTWSLANNTSGASISGPNTGTSVNINTGTSNGSFTLNLQMSTSGFTGSCTQNITVNKPAVSETHVNYSCSNNQGSVNLTVSGGFPPYSFVWSNGATTEDISGLNAGAYTVTVSDQFSCVTSLSATITSLSSLSVSPSATNVSCFSGNSGSVNLTVGGGTSPYSYEWNNGATTQNISGLVAGTYSVIVTGANGCGATASATITQPSSALSGNINSIGNVSCYNGNNGSINMDVSGGTPPYNYQWNNGATTQNLSGISSGTYSVTVTDSEGCTSITSSISVSQPAQGLSAAASSANDVSCFGGNNGSININVSGGTSPYIFAWSNGASTQNISGLAAGNYSATVTDANGCTKAVSAITISQPAAALSISNIAQTNVNCYGDASGDINISVSGGTAPYSYVWSNGENSQDLNNVAAGAYTVVITDANGCNVQSSTITIGQPSAALSGNAATTSNVSCTSGANGAISLTVNGGTPAYTFAWSNGATTQNISGLYAGNYVVTITDSKGCSVNATTSINQPAGSLNSSISGSQNVSCNGGNNGSINLTVNGGTLPYIYQWSNGATTQDISGLASGSYTVTVNDANGCINVSTAVIIQPSVSLSASVSAQSNVSCYGGNTGNVDLTVNGGTAPYSFSWSNGSSAEDQFNLAAGTYTVTVTDANGCVFSNSAITITQPAAALNGSVTASNNVSCYGGSNGAINLTVSGGTGPYSYNWSNGSNSEDLSGISAGTYMVTVTDINGCTTLVSGIAIGQPAASLNSGISTVSNVSCFGGNNGTINLSVSGGTAPYSYSWNNGSTVQNLNNVQAGTYSVTVTDANGCTDIISAITVSQPAGSLNSNVSSAGNVSCNGGNNGSISLNVSGGTMPYSYNWSNGAITQNLNGIPAGNYTVTITDANGCTTINSGITVSQPPVALNGNVASSSNVNCFGGNNGSINLSVNGGTAPYYYSWSNGGVTQNISNLSSGTYTVLVTDNNGCTMTIAGIAVTQPAAALNSSITATGDVNCFGGNNGSVNLNVIGGTAPYTYNWSNGATTQNLINLTAGSYNVSVTDANGCSSAVTGIVIDQPGASLNGNVIATSAVSCFGGNNGSIILNVNGGTSPYSYNWSNGSTSQDLNNVTAGTYSVIITDANGCTFNINGQTISQPPAALNSSVSATSNVSCFGGNNGSITLNVNGGTAPYSYSWSNGANTQNLSNISSGAYSVLVTDANGCTVQSSSIVIGQPASALNGTAATTQNVSCNSGANGTVTLTVAGGTAPYTFNWSTGATTQNISGLYSGTYVVTVTDAQGCIFSASAVVAQPAGALNSAINVSQNVNCFGGSNGSIILIVNGGTAPYTYNWSNGATSQSLSNLSTGTYSVTVTDANGCINVASATVNQPSATLNGSASSTTNVNCFGGNNGDIGLTVNGGTTPYSYQWSNGASTQNLSNLPAGTYTVTVTDINGCSTIVSGIAISQPAAELNGNASSTTNVNCFGGNNGGIILSVNGGTVPYSFQWSNGANTQNITNLAAGTYTVTVTDVNGCVTTVMGIAINEPAAALNGNVSSSTNVNCFGGNNGGINLSVNGGTSPYSYQWSNGASTQNISNLPAGTYTVSVTDANGCSTIVSGISITEPAAALSASVFSQQNVNCFSGLTGSIDLSTTDGTAPYSYSWSNGATTEDLNNLSAGTYTVTVTDANGCVFTISATISQPNAALNASANISQNVSCYSGANGTIDLTATDGTTPYTYNWSNGATTEDINNLSAGTYTVTVTDANGCVFTTSATITQPAGALNATAVVTQNVNCNSGANGAINLTATDGTSPYSYTWSNGQTTEDISNLSTGTYTVTVTDANGCVFTTSATVTQPAGALNASANISQNVSCYSGANGSINLTTTDGTAPYTYNWSNGATTEDISNLGSGTYTVTVTDANGCTIVTSATITQPAGALSATLNGTQSISCFAGNNGSIDLNVINGTAPYSYNWSNGATTEDINNLSAGTYTVTVTDANGCVTTISATISQPNAALNASANVSQNVSCYSGANGSINLTATNGTAPYSYNWSTGSTTEDINNLSAGTYTVTVTDANGCSATTSAIIIQPQASISVSGSGSTSNCLNNVPGDVTINANGGTVPYSYLWNTGATSQNLNNQSAGTYTVTVTDVNGCSTTGSYVITDNSAFQANADGPSEVCMGEAVTLVANSVTGATYQWYYNGQIMGGANGNILVTPMGGTYFVTVSNDCGNFTSDSIVVKVHQIENISTSPNVIVCEGESTQLYATGGVTYEWTPATGLNYTNIPNPTATPTQTTQYVVTITNEFGCSTTAAIEVGMCDTLIIPSGYSPNGDVINDAFVIKGIENFPGNKIWIYNRWGNLVYKTTDYANKWDGYSNVSGIFIGKKVPPGTYFYVLDLNNHQKPMQGYVVVRY